jgi:hypothetical protein
MFEFETTAMRIVCTPALDVPFEDEELPHAAIAPAAATTPIVPTRTRVDLRCWKLRHFRLES